MIKSKILPCSIKDGGLPTSSSAQGSCDFARYTTDSRVSGQRGLAVISQSWSLQSERGLCGTSRSATPEKKIITLVTLAMHGVVCVTYPVEGLVFLQDSCLQRAKRKSVAVPATHGL